MIMSRCEHFTLNPFLQTTLAADFRVFRYLFRVLCGHLNYTMTYRKASLEHLRIYTSLDAVRFPCSPARLREVGEILLRFVGSRPIRNAQGFSRPWVPENRGGC